MKSCITCIWVGCREYGKDAGPCIAYVMSMEEERRIKDNKKNIIKNNTSALKKPSDLGK